MRTMLRIIDGPGIGRDVDYDEMPVDFNMDNPVNSYKLWRRK